MIDIDLSQYTTIDDAANQLSVSVGHVRNMMSEGVLETRKSPFGGKMILCSSIEEYRTKRKATGRPRKAHSE